MSNQNALVQSYVARFDNHIKRESGQAISDALSIESEHVASIASALDLLHHGQRLTGGVSRLVVPWRDMVLLHFDVVRSLANDDIVAASTAQNQLALCFYQVFVQQTGWCLPILYAIIRDLRSLSIRADAFLLASDQKTGHLEEAARTMNRAFSACVTDRSSPIDVSRKWGTYYVVNVLFKTYFKLNSTNLCSTILRSLQSADLPEISRFPISHQVTLKYFTGVIAFYNEKFDAASSDLMFALDRSLGKTVQDKRNKQLILDYLVPAQLIRGILPHPRLFEKYPQIDEIYGEFVASVRSGNVQQFDVALIRHQSELIRRGTWLTVELVRLLVLRTLFRNVWLIHGKTSRIHMSVFQHALELASGGERVDLGQVECFLAIMVDKSFLKGYLSHEKQTVVLSNKDPFPRIVSSMVQ
ncbi:hypothetical protein BASA50_003961 [Batrachochytrium salamandrivorans]|uniref:PCI domain-containing protein n=1 Tax=Batrachochytrium salamandrivorans TaxID=1357716 RepID=A0ABQ8FGU8_9FUNG|nr:hypothetical protein BASA62_005920 [Batrachochytrium salamandrivorans]KAH6582051.1 hypothetical protein BASA60_002165 [Batrachochytrium salamandrivorans]KAH6588757.1 hypothetical protein BASA61_005850 [Batrachochytrium salamandrivorans]KAH6598079.1 hypothetical protein BASA50_003961 [Batrachochytrium salamandrivorans]KAJ1340713.1 hypothetical protein BSLG_004807 [Batrachochytrium salamandrivorans]